MFKKLKDFYKKNRVYSILMIVSILCIVAIMVGVLVYFIGQTSKDKYGNRLEGLDKIKISNKKEKTISNIIKKNELVNSVDIDIKGKLIYIDIELKSGKHTDAESICQSLLDNFSEKEKSFYDIQFIVSNLNKDEEDNFPIMGYMRKNSLIIKWTKYVQ